MELETILLDNALEAERMTRLEAQITTNDHLLKLMDRIATLEAAQADMNQFVLDLNYRVHQLEGNNV